MNISPLKNTIVLLFLFLLGGQSILSQHLVISEKSYTYPFVLNRQSVSNPHAERILEKMKIHSDINVSFSINLTIKITQTSQYQYLAIAELTHSQCNGNFHYRGFDLCKDFIPEYLNFGFDINRAFQPKTTTDVTFRHSTLETIKKIYEWTDSTNSSVAEIKPIFKNIGYDNNWENQFLKKLNQIELYYSADSLFNNWLQTLETIKLENTELLPIFDFTLDDIEKKYEFFTSENIYLILDPNDEKHQKFGNQLNEINQKISNKRHLLNEYLHRIDYRFIESAREAMRVSNTEKAIYNYKKAIEFHPYNIIALKELAKLYLIQANYIQASELIKIIFTKTWPQNKTHSETIALANDIYQAILKTGDKWLKEEEYHRAIDAYSIAHIFCDSIRESICNNAHKQGVVNAKKGILKSYFNVIEKSLERNRPDIAENYVRESKKYQMANIHDIPDDNDIQKMADKVVSKYVNDAMQNIQNGRFALAIRQLDNADSLGHTFREGFSLAYLNESREKAFTGAFSNALKDAENQLLLKNVSMADAKHADAMNFYFQHPEWIKDTLQAYQVFLKIRQLESTQKTERGNQLIARTEYSAALISLQEAKALEQKYILPSNKLLDSLLFAISQPIAFERLNNIGMKIWRNELREAKKIIEEVWSLIQKSNLEKNTDLMNLYQTVVQNYENQKCIFANSEISKLQNQFNNFQNEKAYFNAKNSLLKMIEIQEEFEECFQTKINFDTDLAFIIPAAEYEDLTRQSSIEIRLANYALGLDYYLRADSLYNTKSLQSLGVDKTSFASFFIQSLDNEPMFKTLSLTDTYKKPEIVFELLEIMRKRGVKSTKTRTIQKNLAKHLKEIDNSIKSGLSKKQKLQKYPVSHSWYFWFRLYYLI